MNMINLDNYDDTDILSYELCKQITEDGYRPLYNSWDRSFAKIDSKGYVYNDSHYNFLYNDEVWAVNKIMFENFYKVKEISDITTFFDNIKEINKKYDEIFKEYRDISNKNDINHQQFDFLIKNCKNAKNFFLSKNITPYDDLYKNTRYIDIDSYDIEFINNDECQVSITFCHNKSRYQNHYTVKTDVFKYSELIDFINENKK